MVAMCQHLAALVSKSRSACAEVGALPTLSASCPQPNVTMKTLTRLFSFMYWSRTKTKPRPVRAAVASVLGSTTRNPPKSPGSFTDDDSPPGHKVRWHH